jgi:hypothetical protein
MAPDQVVQIKDLQTTREAVRQYLMDNVGWRAANRDLVWSHRLVIAKLALFAGKRMFFADLESQIQSVLLEAPSPLIQQLTPEYIAEKICDPITAPSPAPPESSAAPEANEEREAPAAEPSVLLLESGLIEPGPEQ